MLRESPKRPWALAQWSRLSVPDDLPALPEATRTRIVEAIARGAASGERRTRRRVNVARAIAIAAAATVILGGSALLRSRLKNEHAVAGVYGNSGAPPASALVAGLDAPSPSSRASASSRDSQVAPDPGSSSRLRLVSGVEIVVGPEARLALPDTESSAPSREELVLDLGSIRVRVPKLPKGHSFGIRTPNAVVSVHGTAFSVEVTKSEPPETTRTKVVVTDGVVSVLHADGEVLLSAGTEWTSSVANASASALRPTANDRKIIGESQRARRAAPAPGQGKESLPAFDAATSIEGKESPSDLAGQNALFSSAMNARDRGDRSLSIALLDEFCRRYPASPLTQDAYVARFRVLSDGGDRGAAAQAARAYLTRYGSGFAEQEARALAFGSDGGL